MKCTECSADTRLCQCAEAERDSREARDAERADRDLLRKTYQRWAQREAQNAEEVKRLTDALTEERARVSNLRLNLDGMVHEFCSERTARRAAENALAEERARVSVMASQSSADRDALLDMSESRDQMREERDFWRGQAEKAQADYRDLQSRVLQAPASFESQLPEGYVVMPASEVPAHHRVAGLAYTVMGPVLGKAWHGSAKVRLQGSYGYGRTREEAARHALGSLREFGLI
jgi:hypothetical protein